MSIQKRIQKKHFTCVFTEQDKAHIQNIRSHLQGVTSDVSAIRKALEIVSKNIDEIRETKNNTNPSRPE